MSDTAAALLAESGAITEPPSRLLESASRQGLTVLAWRDPAAKCRALADITSRYPAHDALLVTDVTTPVILDAWHLVLDPDVVPIEEYLSRLRRADPVVWVFDSEDPRVLSRALRLAYQGASVTLAVRGTSTRDALAHLSESVAAVGERFALRTALTAVLHVG